MPSRVNCGLLVLQVAVTGPLSHCFSLHLQKVLHKVAKTLLDSTSPWQCPTLPEEHHLPFWHSHNIPFFPDCFMEQLFFYYSLQIVASVPTLLFTQDHQRLLGSYRRAEHLTRELPQFRSRKLPPYFTLCTRGETVVAKQLASVGHLLYRK